MDDNDKPLDGPRVSVKVSCRRCSHKRSEYYCVEDGNDVDSGFNYSCAHPAGKGAMDDSTPEWCPMLGERMSDDAVLNSATRLLRVAALTRVEAFTTDAAIVVMSIKAKANTGVSVSGGCDREEGGKLVRKVWIEWAREQPSPKASWLVPWDELSEPDKEIDRRIFEACFERGEAALLAEVNRLLTLEYLSASDIAEHVIRLEAKDEERIAVEAERAELRASVERWSALADENGDAAKENYAEVNRLTAKLNEVKQSRARWISLSEKNGADAIAHAANATRLQGELAQANRRILELEAQAHVDAPDPRQLASRISTDLRALLAELDSGDHEAMATFLRPSLPALAQVSERLNLMASWRTSRG